MTDIPIGVDNESIVPQGNSGNDSLPETPSVEQPLGGATTRKYMDITMPGSGIYGEHDLDKINLRPDQFQAKRKEMFKNLFDSPNFKQALQAFQTELQIRLQISDFLKRNIIPSDNLEPLSPEAKQSMMEKWLGKPLTGGREDLPEKPITGTEPYINSPKIDTEQLKGLFNLPPQPPTTPGQEPSEDK